MSYFDSYQSKWVYANGYTASVISNSMSQGGKHGYFEVAILHGDDNRVCGATPITNDVIGWLSFDEVQPTLDRIRKLGENPRCNHSSTSDLTTSLIRDRQETT